MIFLEVSVGNNEPREDRGKIPGRFGIGKEKKNPLKMSQQQNGVMINLLLENKSIQIRNRGNFLLTFNFLRLSRTEPYKIAKSKQT